MAESAPRVPELLSLQFLDANCFFLSVYDCFHNSIEKQMRSNCLVLFSEIRSDDAFIVTMLQSLSLGFLFTVFKDLFRNRVEMIGRI